jgi:uncharacterized protein YndB with AHSA1/START domain
MMPSCAAGESAPDCPSRHGIPAFAAHCRNLVLKLLKWIAIVVIALAVLLFAGGYAVSPKFSVARSTTIAAPAEKVYALIADPREWKRWTVWNQRDPAMQIMYIGPPSGTGAGWAWKSKSEGDGKMTFTAAEANRRLAYELYFPDFGTTSSGALELAPEGAGTKVTWSINGDMGSNPLFRWLALFGDQLTGPDFEAGLANLKALAEKP